MEDRPKGHSGERHAKLQAGEDTRSQRVEGEVEEGARGGALPEPGRQTPPPTWSSRENSGQAGGDPRAFLSTLFWAMVNAATPEHVLPRHLPPPPKGRTVVVGAGKAAAAMAQVVEELWEGPLSGVVVTRYGHGRGAQRRTSRPRIEVLEAGHPLPDENSVRAARRVLAAVSGLSTEDLVLVLLSGGGSALLTLPAPGLTLDDVIETSRRLLASGATIHEINCVRKHLTRLAGGGLAAAGYPARVVSLAISDVVGNDPTVIASGPTVADPTTFAEARAIVASYGLELPTAVNRHLESASTETLKPGDPRLARTQYVLVATPENALAAAAATAQEAGVTPIVLGSYWQGEARHAAAIHAQLALEAKDHEKPPFVVLSGGETTVTVRGSGQGGRNTEFLLALGLAFADRERSAFANLGRSAFADQDWPAFTAALAADTDGFDGTGTHAGAFLFPDTLARARAAGLDPQHLLDQNDSYRLFSVLGDLLTTGPTYTNVNDFRAILMS